jgi:hypothetical protein
MCWWSVLERIVNGTNTVVRLATIDLFMIENICNVQASEAIFFVKLALQGVD